MSVKPSFFAELKRRNVVRMAGLYLVGAWLLIQVASTVLPTFDVPSWALRGLIITLALGFVPALIFSWVFELTPQGLKRDEEVAPEQSIGPETGRRMDRMIIVVLLLALGYFAFDKFVLTPRRVTTDATSHPSSLPNDTKFNAKSIAVLPFENLSSDKENAYFADGVQDEILTDLARIADLKVISRTSVMQYKDTAKRNLPEIAQALKVAHVLEGSVQRAEHRVRVTAQLIDARTDAHLWAQRFDGDLSDVFAIQSEIAQKIADQLQAVLSPKEKADIAAKPTSDLSAYDLYLRATALLESAGATTESIQREAVRLLEEATTRDPTFVQALCALARAEVALYFFNYEHTETRLAHAKEAIAAAERLKPDAGEVHLAKGILYYQGFRDYEPALAELQRAHAILPNNSTAIAYIGVVALRQGRIDEATQQFANALQLDPQNVRWMAQLSGAYDAVRRYKDSARVLDDAVRLKPDDYYLAYWRAALDRESRADLRLLESLLTSEVLTKTDPNNVAALRINLALDQRDYAAAAPALVGYTAPYFPGGVHREMMQGVIAERMGEPEKAKAAFLAARAKAAMDVAARPDDAQALVFLGVVDAHLGQKEEAVREGERAVELLPVTKDASRGADVLTSFAEIYAAANDFDRALNLLERLARMNFGIHYGDLKLDLRWDPLRGDPRFEKIVQLLAPKS